MPQKINGLWSVAAKPALWKREPISELPTLEIPEVGREYLIKLDGGSVKLDDIISVEYLPASAYLNGVETVYDLEGIRICSGVVKDVAPGCREGNQISEFNTNVRFDVHKMSSLRDFSEQPEQFSDDLELWGYLHEGFFYNVTNLDDYVLVSWASDAYAGARCVLRQKAGKFFLLYCQDWLYGSFDRVHCGNIVVPIDLTKRLHLRLATLGHDEHWAGNMI